MEMDPGKALTLSGMDVAYTAEGFEDAEIPAVLIVCKISHSLGHVRDTKRQHER